MFKFSNNSASKLKECDEKLQKVFNKVIEITPVDFGISTGYRSSEEQARLFAKGRTTSGSKVTNIDGVNNKSKHNYKPSRAVDIYAFINGSASWDKDHLIFLGGLVMGVAASMNINLRWGGNWNESDGTIIQGQNLVDLPHFEI